MDPESPLQHEQFLTLFTSSEPAIRAYIRRLVPTRNDAADVMQGVSLVLWKKFHELDQPSDFRKWSFGVARYETLAWLRNKSRDRLVLAEDVLLTLAHESERGEERLTAQREALEDCLEKLPQPQRTAILAAYAPDAAMQDVAKQSGRTVAAFYQWLHRMRLQLLECTRRTLQSEGLT